MNDQDRTREQLIAELVELRQRVAEERATPELKTAAALLQVAPLGIHECDTEGRITFVNPSQETITGYTTEELIGTYVWDRIVPGPEKDALPAYFKRLVSEQPAPTPFFAKNVRKSGEVFDVWIDWNYIRNAQGEVVGFVSIVSDITERKQAALKLQESEERFRRVFEEGPLGFSMFGPDLRTQHVNQRLCDMLGYSEHELLELGVAGVTYPDDLEKDRQLVLSILRGEIPYYTIDKRYVRKDGHVFWGQLTASMIPDADGRPTHGIGMLGDITERKRAEEAIRQSEQRMRLHVEQTPLAVIEWDLELQVSKWNPGAERIFGYTSEEALGRHFALLVPPKAKEQVDRVWDALRVEKGGERSTNENITKDGRMILCEWYNTPLVNAEGHVVGFASLAEDITERKRMETALRASEAKYRRLHQSMMDAFVSVGMDGQIQEFNDAYRQLLGYEPAELLTLTYSDITPTDWHSFEAGIVRDQILPRGYSDTYEKEYRRKDGTIFPVELRTFLITDDDGKPAAMWAIVRDITERRRAETALRQAHDELEQKVKERTTELRESNELLRAEVEQRRQAEANLKVEQRALRRMLLATDHERRLITYELHDGVAQQLLGAMMHFQAVEPPKGRKSKTADTYRGGLAALRQAASEIRRVMNWLRTPVLEKFGLVAGIDDVASQLRSAPEAPEIEYRHAVNFKRLEPTLENTLFRIAQEAMTNACRHSQSDKVRVTLTQEGDGVTLEVQDWGIGFDQESIVENHYGLEGIRERSRILGGKLHISSEPGLGTVVRVTLSVIEAADKD